MSVMTPIAEIRIEDLTALKATIIDELKRRVSDKSRIPVEELIVRDADPKDDCKLPNPFWVHAQEVAHVYEKYWSPADDNKVPREKGYVCLAISDLTGNLTGVKLLSGADSVRDEWQFQPVQMYKENYPTALPSKIEYFVEGETLIVQVRNRATGPAILPMRVLVCERMGETILPKNKLVAV